MDSLRRSLVCRSELHRNKPLLPVVTRSGVYEEDEIDGEIRKCLRSKSAQNRAEQESDVQSRAEEKLAAMGVATSLLKKPVSISTYTARAQNQTLVAMTDAGVERLYEALIEIERSIFHRPMRRLRRCSRAQHDAITLSANGMPRVLVV